MTMNLLIQCLVAALACAGLIGGIYALFFGEGASSNRQKGSPMGMLRGFIDAKEDMEVDRVLKKAGIHLTSIQYSLYRVIAVTLILVVGIVSAYAMEGLSPIGVALVLTLLLLLLSLPKEEILGKKSPFLRITGKLEQGRRAKLDNELFDSCITLKNLAIVQREQPLSADFVYEQLMENANKLRPVYAEMISRYRTGRDEEAFAVLNEMVGTKQAKNFAMILSKLDQINPIELIEQVVLFQETLSELRMTNKLKAADRDSIITTMFSTALIFTLLLNFAVVVVFMDTMAMLTGVF